jgi:phage/plasmid-like protein (TIGR03299 family)
MAHNLATINGRIAMAYQGQTPWHKLGTRTNGITSVEDAIKIGNLDWTVELRPMFLSSGAQVPNRSAVVRPIDSAILGTVGDRYTPIQNNEGFAILSDACSQHGVTIETVGALGQGERVFMLAKLPTIISVVPGDDIRGYFLVSMAHDGTGSFFARPTPIRVVCQNTLNAAVSQGIPDVLKLRHTASAPQRIAEAQRLVTQMIAAMQATGDTFATLASKRLNREQLRLYIEHVFPTPKDAKVSTNLRNKREAIERLAFWGVGADLAGADPRNGSTTLWGAYNAVTEYFDHVRPAKSSNPAEANESAIFGSGADLKLLALNTARELVAA